MSEEEKNNNTPATAAPGAAEENAAPAAAEENAAPAAAEEEDKNVKYEIKVTSTNDPEKLRDGMITVKEVEVPAKFKSIVEEIEKMSVIDLHELVKVFEKKFGVSAAAVAAAPAAGDAGEEDTGGLVKITLEDAGATKIQVIKVVKEILGLGLKEAKDLVDAAPKPIKEGITKEEAEELKGKLEESGAKVSVA